MEYTKRRNLNRGFMKLDAWQRVLDLFARAFKLSENVDDSKLNKDPVIQQSNMQSVNPPV
jgi:hypothetical protein